MLTVTASDYDTIFEAEQQHDYPLIDAFERRMGYAIERNKLEDSARVLACPLKKHAPNWQHGRVLYALARKVLSSAINTLTMLDIGTAKGFSALCLQWAFDDTLKEGREYPVSGRVYSVDVIDPQECIRRNTVAEVDGLKTLAETLAPWPEASAIQFQQSTGIAWLKANKQRLQVAFVDGKHDGEVVIQEGRLIAAHQEPNDAVMFDDVHIPSVRKAVSSLEGLYQLEYLPLEPERQYAIGIRR